MAALKIQFIHTGVLHFGRSTYVVQISLTILGHKIPINLKSELKKKHLEQVQDFYI